MVHDAAANGYQAEAGVYASARLSYHAALVDRFVATYGAGDVVELGALSEIRRILRPGGHLVCVWNVRDTSVPWVRACTEIVDDHAGETPRHRTMEWRRAIDADPGFEPVDDWAIDNPRPSSPDDVVARTLSTSFIATLESDVQQGVLDEIRAVTERLGSAFTYPYRSELQAWRLR